MDQRTDLFWQSDTTVSPVERRILFPVDRKAAELTLSLMPSQPVPDLASMGDNMVKAAAVPTNQLKDKGVITPQLVFATARNSQNGGAPVVSTASHREIPLLQLDSGPARKTDQLDYVAQLKLAEAPTPTAAMAAGDSTVGFLVGDTALHFYPMLVISLPEDLESYREGSGNTSDLLPLLPFQN